MCGFPLNNLGYQLKTQRGLDRVLWGSFQGSGDSIPGAVGLLGLLGPETTWVLIFRG